jgi:hypothetical protein
MTMNDGCPCHPELGPAVVEQLKKRMSPDVEVLRHSIKYDDPHVGHPGAGLEYMNPGQCFRGHPVPPVVSEM